MDKHVQSNLNYKQLLDEVFVISRIIKVEVGVISQRLRLITLTESRVLISKIPGRLSANQKRVRELNV